MFATEAMSFGKPVLCYINNDLIGYLPDLPIIPTHRYEIYKNLKYLIQNPTICQEIGNKGRKFIEKYHDADQLAQTLITSFN